MRLADCKATGRHAVRYTQRLVRAASSYSSGKIFSSLPDGFRSPARSTPNPNAKNIAVLGGGITGLTTAYHLARTIPSAKISIFERGERLGGWVDSELVDVGSGRSALFEWGPRSLRPDLSGAGRATLQLLADISLAADVIFTEKSEAAAQNRFLYYPDRLTRMPSPYGNPFLAIFGAVSSLLTEPIFKGLPTSLLAEPTVARRPDRLSDESVGAFLRRRFGVAAADNLASALFHGIYAGDIYQLSARTCLPMLWYLECRDPDGGGIILEQADLFLKGQKLTPLLDFTFRNLNPNVIESIRESYHPWQFLRELGLRSAMYTLAGGLGRIITQLIDKLQELNNVDLYLEADVQSLALSKDGKAPRPIVRFQGPSSDTARADFDYVVSTLRPGTLAKLLTKSDHQSQTVFRDRTFESVDKAATVMVVNLYYESSTIIPQQYAGFGYLIPRSVALDQNPERALGVIFSSMSSGPRGPDIQQRSVPPSEELLKMRRDSVESLEKASAKHMGEIEELRSKTDLDAAKNAALLSESTTLDDHQREKTLKDVAETFINYPSQPPLLGQDTASGTKLTVMLGGHWWDGWTDSDYPDEQEGIEMAKRILQRHMNIDAQPTVAKARLQRDCIPQYPVGYRDHMANIHNDVLIDQFKGRVKVAGPWWQGAVGVNDCIRRAKETALAIEHQWDARTGLEDFVGEEKWLLIDKRTGSPTIDRMCKGWNTL